MNMSIATYDELIQRSYGYDPKHQSQSPAWRMIRQLYIDNFQDAIVMSPVIPKKIHQIWLGPKNMPVSYVRYANSWIEKNPAWEYKLWTESDLKDIDITKKKLFDNASNYGMRSDILRYEILRQIGGVYVDMDFECLKSFDDLLDLNFFTGIGYDKELQLYIGLMGSIPNHGIMNGCCENLNTDYSGEKGSVIMDVTGANYFTKQFLSFAKFYQEGIVAFPMEFFYPFPNNLRGKDDPYKYVTENSYAIHHWGISWTKKIQDGLDTRR